MALQAAFSTVSPAIVKTSKLAGNELIIRRAFYREATQTTLAVALILVVLFLVLGLTKLLGRAAGGRYGGDLVLWLLGLELAQSLAILVPLALYLGVLMTLGRWYRDSEMTVWAACGVGMASMSRPVMQLALAFSVVVAALALYVSPWADATAERIKDKSRDQAELSAIPPGVFTELRNSGRIFYVERIDAGAVLRNVFVHDRRSQRQNIVVAQTARQITDVTTGEKFIVLENGSLYEGTPGEPDYEVVDFETYKIRLEPAQSKERATPIKGLSNRELLRAGSRSHIVNLNMRISRPVMVLVLALFALVMAHTDPRKGRMGNVLAAILVYVVYTNALGVGETLLHDGRVPLALGLWWVHAAFAIFAGYFLMRRARNKPLLPRLRAASQ
ncbi:MAG: LPS export ABC transporter permease LptF [Nitrospira sp.]|nr:LPS export ABC transporter permease LptF [Nitrospira sp.]